MLQIGLSGDGLCEASTLCGYSLQMSICVVLGKLFRSYFMFMIVFVFSECTPVCFHVVLSVKFESISNV